MTGNAHSIAKRASFPPRGGRWPDEVGSDEGAVQDKAPRLTRAGAHVAAPPHPAGSAGHIPPRGGKGFAAMTAVLYHAGGFPPRELDWPRLLPLIGPANAAIARYDGVLDGVPNTDVLLAPLTAQEAVLSSRIEGTQATLGEVLEFEAQGELFDESTPKKADIREVLNYRAALHEAIRLLDTLPLSAAPRARDASRVDAGRARAQQGAGRISPHRQLDRPRRLHDGNRAVRSMPGGPTAAGHRTRGSAISTPTPPTASSNSPSSMPSSRRCIRSWTATGGSGG